MGRRSSTRLMGGLTRYRRFGLDRILGRLDFVQAAPAGGYVARAMDVNSAGDLAVVGLQEGAQIAILERDLGSGVFREQVATIDVKGQTWATVWDE